MFLPPSNLNMRSHRSRFNNFAVIADNYTFVFILQKSDSLEFMKSALLSMILLFAAFAVKAQDNAVQPMDGTECSNLFFKALLEEDSNVLSNLLANDFTVVSFQGQTVDGGQLQQAVAEGHIVIESGMLSGARTRTYGDVAVVTGQWSAKGRIENNGFQGELSYMTVCVKSGGRWKVSAVQFTPIQ